MSGGVTAGLLELSPFSEDGDGSAATGRPKMIPEGLTTGISVVSDTSVGILPFIGCGVSSISFRFLNTGPPSVLFGLLFLVTDELLLCSSLLLLQLRLTWLPSDFGVAELFALVLVRPGPVLNISAWLLATIGMEHETNSPDSLVFDLVLVARRDTVTSGI